MTSALPVMKGLQVNTVLAFAVGVNKPADLLSHLGGQSSLLSVLKVDILILGMHWRPAVTDLHSRVVGKQLLQALQ